jgi:hypothetical protein
MFSSAPNVFSADADSYLGRLTFAKKGYLLELPGEKSPVCGVRFYNPHCQIAGVRAFRVVFPKELPYFPPQKDLELCNLAKTGGADPGAFTTFASKLPQKTADGRVFLSFGPELAILPSIKNFILVDGDDDRVFVIYKSSPGACGVRFRLPITPVQAFGIAIACIAPERGCDS